MALSNRLVVIEASGRVTLPQQDHFKAYASILSWPQPHAVAVVMVASAGVQVIILTSTTSRDLHTVYGLVTIEISFSRAVSSFLFVVFFPLQQSSRFAM